MLSNKYLFFSLVFGGSNIDRIFQQCIRNLSFEIALRQKLKLKKGKTILSNVCINHIEDVNLLYNNIVRVNRFSQFGSCIDFVIEGKRIEQENDHHEFNKPSNIDKVISKNITEEKGYIECEKLNLNNNDIRKLSSYSLMSDDMIEEITSFPILGSESAAIDFKTSSKTPRVPSVSVILRETMSPESRRHLEKWKADMIAKLGQDQFNIYSQDLLKNGRLFHSYIQNTLKNEDVTIAPQLELACDSVKSVLMELEKVETLETYVVHPNLLYRGIVDCIAIYRGELCVIDWKKSDKDKPTLGSTYDAPVQVSAYIGAVNASNAYPFTVAKGLVVVGYTNGQPATVHELKDDLLQQSWNNWLTRLKQFYTNANNK